MVPRSSAPAPGALRPFTALVLALAPSLLFLVRCGIWPSFPDDVVHHDGGVGDGASDGGHNDGGPRDVVSDLGAPDSGPFRTCPTPGESQFALNMFAAPSSTGVPRDLAFDGHGALYVGTDLGLDVFAPDGSLTAMPRMGVTGIQSLRINPTAAELFVATGASGMPSGALSAVDPTTGMVTRPLSTGLSNPGGVAVRADGTIFVADSAGSIVRIRPDGSAAVLTIQISSPTGLALTPDGLKLYAGSSSAGRGIFELDLDAQGALLGTPTPYVSAFLTGDGLAFDSCGYLYVTDRDGLRIVRIPPGGGTFDSIVQGMVPVGFSPRGLAFGTGGTFLNTDLFVADDSGAIYAMHIGVPGAALPHP